MSKPTRIGFIGASVTATTSFYSQSWAARSHVPYLQSDRNKHYQITALQNSSKESAEKAAKAFNLDSSVAHYNDPKSTASDPNVDLVAVSVNVPSHRDAIMPALHAGKDIFVEWPLARTLEDAEEMTQLARSKNLHTLVGLQARQSPSIVAAKRLVSSGAIGEIVGSTMHGYGLTHSDTHAKSFSYGLPIENGANIMTIPFGHAVDALCFVLGEWEYVQATLANRWPEFDLIDTNGAVAGRGTKTSHDYISVNGKLLQSGGVVSVVYQGGKNPTGGPGFIWQIEGTKGTLLLEGPMGHVQMWQPTIKVIYKGEKEMKDVEGVHFYGDDYSYSVGQAWDAFARMKNGEQVEEGTVSTFEDALVRHRMIDAIYKSNEKGTREKYV